MKLIATILLLCASITSSYAMTFKCKLTEGNPKNYTGDGAFNTIVINSKTINTYEIAVEYSTDGRSELTRYCDKNLKSNNQEVYLCYNEFSKSNYQLTSQLFMGSDNPFSRKSFTLEYHAARVNAKTVQGFSVYRASKLKFSCHRI